MTGRIKNFLTWRLKLILTCGAIFGIALGLFSYHVSRMADKPIESKSFSIAFNASNRSIPEFFRDDKSTVSGGAKSSVPIPAIDQASSRNTEFALFALG